jgi:hypothetical protein
MRRNTSFEIIHKSFLVFAREVFRCFGTYVV